MAAGVRDIEHAILPAEARRLAKAGGYELCRAAILVKGPDGVRSGVGDVDLDAVGGKAGGQFKAVERGADLAGIEVEVAQSAVAAVADEQAVPVGGEGPGLGEDGVIGVAVRVATARTAGDELKGAAGDAPDRAGIAVRYVERAVQLDKAGGGDAAGFAAEVRQRRG